MPRPASLRAASTSSRLWTSPCSIMVCKYAWMACLASARASLVGDLPQRIRRALCRSACSGLKSRARFGSSGLAQPSRRLCRSRNTSNCLCQPGGQGLNALPVESSTRGMTKCNSWCPACECRTHRILRWSGSSPAKASFSKSSITFSSCSGVTLSSGCHERTPAVNFHLLPSALIRSRVMSTSPRKTCGGFSSLPW